MRLATRFFKRERYRRVVDAILLIAGAAVLFVIFRAAYILWFLVFS